MPLAAYAVVSLLLTSVARDVVLDQLGPVHVVAKIEQSSLSVRALKKERVLFSRRVSIPSDGMRSVAMRTLRVRGVGSPLILIVADGPAADGAWVAPMLLGERNGTIAELVNLDGVDRIESGVCVGSLGPRFGDGVAVARSVIGRDAALAPHQYDITVYRWHDGAIRRELRRMTTNRHAGTFGAFRETGVVCEERVAAMVLDR